MRTVIIAALLLLGLALSGCAKKWGNAPDFSFNTFDGQTLALASTAGKPVVLNFWADW